MNINTQIVQALDPDRDRAAVSLAARLLRDGKLVVLPTETVYGIGANALDSEAVQRIFAAKGRPQDNPLIAHIAEMQQLDQLVSGLPPGALKLAQTFWPGPLTMVLPRGKGVPDVVSAGLPTVAVRMPSLPVARAIIRESGVPVAAPSANVSGRPSPTTVQHCIQDLSGKVDLIVDGGPSPVGVESTVVSLVGDRPRLLRPGAVTLAQLSEVLEDVDVDPGVSRHVDDGAPVSSPGMKYKHYAPRANVVLVDGTDRQFRAFLERQEKKGTYALVFDEDIGDLPVPAMGYGPREDSEAQARGLFAALRKLDELGAVQVYARTPCKAGMGLAVYNRLVRAAGFSEIKLTDRVD